MAIDQTFVNQETVIQDDWLNNVNTHVNSKGSSTLHAANRVSVSAIAGMTSTETQAALAELNTNKISITQVQSGAVVSATAGGTADAITATLSPAPGALTNGMRVQIKASGANTSTTPTLNLNSLGAKTIVKLNNQPLFSGDIAGAGQWIDVIYDSTLDKWVLENPAAGIPQMQSVSASVAANALTIGLNPTSLSFRSTTLSSGSPVSRSISTSISLTVPSGATLGTVNGQLSRIVLLAIDNAGTVELAVVNISGGSQLDETNLISTTAISGTSNSANVVYSQTARTNVAYRVAGVVDSTQATAGTWASAPSLVQPAGGQALAAMSSVGYGQTWQNFTGSRTAGTTYYNTTGKPIEIIATATNGTGTITMSANINGAGYFTIGSSIGPGALSSTTGHITVPAGQSYALTTDSTPNFSSWRELR